MNGGLDALLSPRAVAVVGASPEPAKRGHLAVRALLEAGFEGGVYPVNPRGGELLGLPVLRSVEALPAGVDLALICTPAHTVPELITACGRAGVRGAVVLALGFGEIGGEGLALDGRLRAAIAASGVRVVGPNTSGLANPRIGLNLFGAGALRPGGLGVVSQSGNVMLEMMLETQQRPALGLSACVGIGNAVDITPAEYVAWFADDAATRAVALYVEGVGNGAAFLDAAAAAAARKPVVLLKGGRSAAGHGVVRTHTGALSGEYAVLAAALREAGVLEVQRSDELFALAETLATQPLHAAGGLAILSDGGGHATLTADRATELGVRLADLTVPCRDALRSRLGEGAAVTNPIDLAGAADRDPLAFADAAVALLAEPDVGSLLVVGLFGGYARRFSEDLAESEHTAAERMSVAAVEADKTLVVHTMYAGATSAALDHLRSAGVPVHASLEVACRCAAEPLNAPARAQRAALRVRRAAESEVAPSPVDDGAQRRVIGPDALEPEIRDALAAFGVTVAPARFCRSAAEAASAAAASGGKPVAVRVVAAGVSHKTEVGGVRLGVGAGDAETVFDEMCDRVARFGTVRGALVGPMLDRPVTELLVGVRSDPVFGRVLAVGAGGTAAEVWRDVVLRVPPVHGGDVKDMLDELRLAPILRGWRGGPAADGEAVAAVALALLACAAAHPELTELEINPLFVYPEGAVAVDVRAHVGWADSTAAFRPEAAGRSATA